MRKRIFLLLLPLCLISCGKVSQEDYDSLMYKYNQLEKESNDYKSQLSSCQSELADYKEKCENLQEQKDNVEQVTTKVKNLYNDVLFGNISGTDDLLRRLETILNDMNN